MQHNLTSGLLIKDRYKLTERIGQGSFGEVWLANDIVDNRNVALKMYQWLDREGMAAFTEEMETTKDLSHPNLLIPTAADEWEQRPFYVMEYCEKGSVSNLAGHMSEDMAWRFIRDVASGLAYLHGLYEPIVHQDVKPYNIVISDDNTYKITDFGISTKVRDQLARHSDRRNPNAGALAYMAPERFTPDSLPLTSSDIWAFGVTIYELLSGRLPFSGMGGGMLIGGAEIPHIPMEYSEQLDKLVEACMQKETWSRPTAQAIEQYADAVLRGETPVAPWETASGAPAAPVSAGDAEELREIEGMKTAHESGRKGSLRNLAATVAGIIVVGGLLLFGINAMGEDDEEDTEKVEAAIEDNDPAVSDNLADAGDAPEDEAYTEPEAGPAAQEAAGEEPAAAAPAAQTAQAAQNEPAEPAKAAPAQEQTQKKAPASRTEAPQQPAAQQPAPRTANGRPSTAGSGYQFDVKGGEGYRGPEDTGRPQNQVDRRDYKGQDRNGHVSRDASANPAARSYTGDKRYKKPGDPLPQGKSKRATVSSGKSTGKTMGINNELRMAITYGDYVTLKHFADAGDVNAYVPMADACIRRSEFAEAEKYAKKAKAAGVPTADRVFDVLRKMGYYD